MITGWPKGMDNIHQDNELGDDTLRRVVNMDVLDSGKLRMRRGTVLSLAASHAHSLWDDGSNNAYYVEANTLKKFNRDETAMAIGTVEAGSNHLSYVKVNSDIYFSSKTASGRIGNDVLNNWGIEVPSAPPVLMEGLGSLYAGVYHAVVTFVTADGRESGASAQTKIELTEAGGIASASLPNPTSQDVVRKRLYLTAANGEMLFMAKEVDADQQFVNIGSESVGSELRTQFMVPPPFSTCLAYVAGRIYMVDAEDPTIVWYTEANSYDLVDRRKNFYQFGSPVTLIAATRNGLYICEDVTHFISSPGSANESKAVVFDFGAIAETAKSIPNTSEYIWLSEKGPVIGHEGGAAELLSSDQLAPGKMNKAASMVREQDSVRQFVVVGNKTEGSAMQAGSYAEAEITRRSNQ